MNGVYKTNIYSLHSSLWVKTNGPSVTAIVLFCFGTAPLSKIAQLQSPRAHSLNQNLSWPYIFVYYELLNVRKIAKSICERNEVVTLIICLCRPKAIQVAFILRRVKQLKRIKSANGPLVTCIHEKTKKCQF